MCFAAQLRRGSLRLMFLKRVIFGKGFGKPVGDYTFGAGCTPVLRALKMMMVKKRVRR